MYQVKGRKSALSTVNVCEQGSWEEEKMMPAVKLLFVAQQQHLEMEEQLVHDAMAA